MASSAPAQARPLRGRSLLCAGNEPLGVRSKERASAAALSSLTASALPNEVFARVQSVLLHSRVFAARPRAEVTGGKSFCENVDLVTLGQDSHHHIILCRW